ncbi:Mitochondrial inner membrane protein oxa1l [Thoreauomyces humboldtii]|nr:Mitochondrial inner membrane protein oxa1l [Thoreauomyces humboldtii]
MLHLRAAVASTLRNCSSANAFQQFPTLRSAQTRSFIAVARINGQSFSPRSPGIRVRTFFWSPKQAIATDPLTTAAPAGTHFPAPPPISASSDASIAAASPVSSPVSAATSQAAPHLATEHATAAIPSTTPSFITDASTSLADAGLTPILTDITQIGDLHTLGLASNSPSGLAQQFIEAIHVTTGLPWWATIACSTLLIRVALTPLILRVQRTSAKMHNISGRTKPLQEEMMRQKNDGDMVSAQKTMLKLRQEYKKEGVNPLGGLLALVQAPIFISFFFGLKGMAELPVPGLATGGFAWFTDLTLADPTYVLPVLASLGMLGVMEIGAEMGGQGGQAQSKGMKNFLRVALVASIPFTASLPAAIFMYWVSTNLFSLLQAWAIKHPRVRTICGIPQLDRTVVTPAGKSIASVSRLSVGDSVKHVKAAREQRREREEKAKAAGERIRKAAKNVRT